MLLLKKKKKKKKYYLGSINFIFFKQKGFGSAEE